MVPGEKISLIPAICAAFDSPLGSSYPPVKRLRRFGLSLMA
jgi:hypothetical protein